MTKRTKSKKKRKLSVYNMHMKAEMRKGKTFKQAVSSWRPRTKVGKALAVRQVGARYAGKPGKKKLYSLNGGLFTQAEVVRARARVGATRLGKRKAYKVRVHSSTMAKRKRKTTRRRSNLGSLGLGKIGGLLKNAGLAFAIGAGTMQLANMAGTQLNIPQLRQYAPILGAITSFTSVSGIPGIIAGGSFLLSSGLFGGGTGQGQAQGTGAFV